MGLELRRRIGRWRLELLRALWLEGSLSFGSWLLAVLLAAVLADAALTLPHVGRWAMFWVGALAFAVGLYRHFLRPLARLSPPALLQAVSRLRPELGPYLGSAWELARQAPPPNTSAELVEAHIAAADRMVAALPRERLFTWRPAAGRVRRLGALAAAWGLGLPWLQPERSLQRVLAPWRDASLESLVAVEPGDRRAVWGSTLVLRAAWRAQARTRSGNGELSLWLRSAGRSWERMPWDESGPEGASFRVDSLAAPLEYRVAWRDLRTRAYALAPIPLPRLSEVRARVHVPGSAEPREAALDEGGELSALRGSWVVVSGRPEVPLESASAAVSFLGAPVKLGPRPDDRQRWEASFPLQESGSLRFELVSRDGTRDPDPVVYPLKAVEDQPPAAELLSPAFELETSPRERLPVTYSVRDDYGLASAVLVYRVSGGPEVEVPLKRFGEPSVEYLGEHGWDLSKLPSGSRVEFWVKAVDNARPRGQAGLSAKGMLHLVDFESTHAQTRRLWEGMEKGLNELAEREQLARRLLRELAAAAPDAREALKAKWEELEAKLGSEWRATVKDLEAFAKAMREDAYANPGMTEAAAAVSEALSSMQSAELPKASASAKAGDYGDAERRHGRLESGLRKAARLLKDGREVQSMQDLWGEAHRMDQAGGELRAALDRLRQTGRQPSAEEKRRLGESLAKLRKQMEELAKAIEQLPKADPGTLRDAKRKVVVLPLRQAQAQADALAAALERGDYAAAARIAEQLSEQLARMRSGLAEAAGASAAENSSSAKMAEVMARWKEAIDLQSRSAQLASQLEQEKLDGRLSAQAELLKELARLQGALNRDAAKLGGVVPFDALAAMRSVLREFEAGQVRQAPADLERAIGRLKTAAAGYSPVDGQPAPPAAELSALAEREADILERLSRGAGEAPMSEEQLSGMMAAGAVQRQARQKTAGLSERIDELAAEAGPLLGEVKEPLSQAQAEQGSAEQALSARDSGTARRHADKALEILEKGYKDMSDAFSKQQQIEQGQTAPFGSPRGIVRPAGARSRTGADTGFVPLPGKDDYQPPREIRREVEKSLQERRPRAFEGIIRDYLKRMSQ